MSDGTGSLPPGPMVAPGSERAQDEDRGPVGPFPSWGWVYGTVLVYGLLVIVVLWILTGLLDPGAGS